VSVAGRDLATSEVVFIKPVGGSFWSQLDGGIDLGYSMASAGDEPSSRTWELVFGAPRPGPRHPAGWRSPPG